MFDFSCISPELSLVSGVASRILMSDKNFLTSDLAKFVLRNSKKLRSGIALLGVLATGEDVSEKIIRVCALTEIIHNASLIHDDVVDNSSVRRGKLTFNKRFGSKSAVIAGDFLLSIVLNELADLGMPEVTKSFAVSMSKMCKGEINQLFSTGKVPSVREYLKKSKNKTALLFVSGMFAALHAACSEKKSFFPIFNNNSSSKISEYEPCLLAFAENFGIAYQIYDDILNFASSSEDKPVGNDFKEGIFTAPVIYFSLDFPEKSLQNLTCDDILKSNALGKSKALMDEYLREALENTSRLPDNRYKESLQNLCYDLIEMKIL